MMCANEKLDKSSVITSENPCCCFITEKQFDNLGISLKKYFSYNPQSDHCKFCGFTECFNNLSSDNEKAIRRTKKYWKTFIFVCKDCGKKFIDESGVDDVLMHYDKYTFLKGADSERSHIVSCPAEKCRGRDVALLLEHKGKPTEKDREMIKFT